MDNVQVIGIDVANGKDFTAITDMCGKCKTVIDIKLYDQTINQIDLPLYIKCPVCGAKIKRHIIA